MNLRMEHLECLMSEQKEVRNTQELVVSVFFRPFGHEEEMEGTLLTNPILGLGS
jgi:hypothetical protein